MKVALITTTIHVPEVLRLHATYDPDVLVLIAGDRGAPHESIRSAIKKLPNAIYYSDDEQESLGYHCSPVIGWNKIMRRNLCLLEALRAGADIIVSIDDDNIPISTAYFTEFRRILATPFHGPMVAMHCSWVNVGALLQPPVCHRGFPAELRHDPQSTILVRPATGIRVGIAEGICLGDPDIDAVERLVNRPVVTGVSEILRTGIVVDPACWAPVNSQNTGFTKLVAPFMAVLVGVGRYDDIFGGLIAQAAMRPEGLLVHYGPPFAWQQRNPQSILRNLHDEMFGMQYCHRFADDLRDAEISLADPVASWARLSEHFASLGYLPPVVSEFALAWAKDLERVLA